MAVNSGARCFCWTWWAAAVAGGVCGLGAYQLVGGSHTFNVLAPPALALVCWSMAAYALIAVRWIFGGRLRVLSSPLTRWLQIKMRQVGFRVREMNANGLPQGAAQITAHLHIFAAGLAAGVIAGIYLRGLVVEYRASWESTFLGAEHAAALLRILLGPASLITGMPSPEAIDMEALRKGAPAAKWLHLWAVTVAMFCLAPRLLLATFAGLSAARAQASQMSSGDLPAKRTTACSGAPLAVLAYCLPSGETRARNQLARLSRMLDAAGSAEFVGTVSYGGEDQATALIGDRLTKETQLVLLAGIATTPEAETHGRLVSLLALQFRPPVVVLDTEEWRARGLDSSARLTARVAAWRAAAPEAADVVVFEDISGNSAEREP